MPKQSEINVPIGFKGNNVSNTDEGMWYASAGDSAHPWKYKSGEGYAEILSGWINEDGFTGVYRSCIAFKIPENSNYKKLVISINPSREKDDDNNQVQYLLNNYPYHMKAYFTNFYSSSSSVAGDEGNHSNGTNIPNYDENDTDSKGVLATGRAYKDKLGINQFSSNDIYNNIYYFIIDLENLSITLDSNTIYYIYILRDVDPYPEIKNEKDHPVAWLRARQDEITVELITDYSVIKLDKNNNLGRILNFYQYNGTNLTKTKSSHIFCGDGFQEI